MAKEELSEFADDLAVGVMGIKNNWEFWPEKLEDIEYAFQNYGKVWVNWIGGMGSKQIKTLILDMLNLESLLHIWMERCQLGSWLYEIWLQQMSLKSEFT